MFWIGSRLNFSALVFRSQRASAFDSSQKLREADDTTQLVKLVAMNTEYTNSRTAPSLQVNFSLAKKYHRRRLVMREKIANLEKAAICTLSGEATKVTPKMHVMFMKPLPTILPSARSKCPLRVAAMLVANSGTLVPNATIVAPTTTGGTPTLTLSYQSPA